MAGQSLTIGKLYYCPNNILLVFPDFSSVTEAQTSNLWLVFTPIWNNCQGGDRETAEMRCSVASKCWSKYFDVQIHHINPEEVFLLLEEKISENREYFYVLAGETLGWVVGSPLFDVVGRPLFDPASKMPTNK